MSHSHSPAGVPPRNQSLDVLRGLAIVMVLFNHLEPFTVPMLPALSGPAGYVYWHVKSIGWTGVDMFFVLSGFLISGLLFKELEQTGRLHLPRFWVRRAFKILPSYWLLLAVLAFTGATHWLAAGSAASLARSLAEHLLFAQNYLAHNPNGPTWSLAVEEHFYLLMPLLLWWLWPARQPRDSRAWRPLFTAFVVILAGIPLLRLAAAFHGLQVEDFRRTHFRLDGLTYGVLAQFLCRYHRSALEPLRRHPAVALGASLALVSCGFFFGQGHPGMFIGGFTLLSIGYTVLLLTLYLNGCGRWEKTVVVRAASHVGRWSYNIFLWNFFLWALPLPGYRPAQAWVAAHVAWAPGQLAAHFVVFALFAIALGAALTELFETPALNLRDRIRWRARPGVGAADGRPVPSQAPQAH